MEDCASTHAAICLISSTTANGLRAVLTSRLWMPPSNCLKTFARYLALRRKYIRNCRHFWPTHCPTLGAMPSSSNGESSKASNHGEITSLDKLAFIGRRAMGSLEFLPETSNFDPKEDINLKALIDLAQQIYTQRESARIDPRTVAYHASFDGGWHIRRWPTAQGHYCPQPRNGRNPQWTSGRIEGF